MHISDRLVLLVESSGLEVPVTVVVSGTVVVGTLCPMSRYDRYMTESLSRARFGGYVGSGSMGPPEDSEREQVRETWEQIPEEDRPESFPQFALRDVTIQSGTAMNWRHAHFLLVRAGSVDAIHLGFEAP